MPTGNHEPLNQVRLTNVAVVRLSRGGHRFEVACYRNKIVNYRQGTETDLSEVLQTDRVFTNVSRGEFANKKILQKVFDTSDEAHVCKLVLDEGDVQVSDMERSARLESTAREVASMVSERCVHPDSRRPYTVTQVRDAMRIAGFMVHPTHGAKQQFLDCVKLLRRTGALDVERAKMELALVLLPVSDEDNNGGDGGDCDDLARRRENVIELLINAGVVASDIVPPPSGNNDENDSNRISRIIFQSDPSLYRKLDDIAKDPSVRVRLEIVRQCVIEEGEVTLGSELERRDRRRLQGEQQQRHDDHITTLENLEQHMDDFGDGPLANLSNLAIEEDDDENNDDESPSHLVTTGGTATATFTSRKAQKAAQKKSKKAKRREKEENAEREVRVEAEKTRQRERADRLGIVVDDTISAITTNASSHTHPSSSIDGTSIERGDPVASTTSAPSLKPCNTCGGAFTPGEYRLHFRSDWHRYNVKLKLKGVTAVSEREFLLCDSDIFFE